MESEQLAWLPGWLPETELATALKANPAVEWFLRHKNPKLDLWVNSILEKAIPDASTTEIRKAEVAILRSMNDLVCYAISPDLYDKQPFLRWDSNELTSMVDFEGKLVADIGAGTGRLTFVAARGGAHAVFAVEPVGTLRRFIKEKARKLGLPNVFAVSGLITDLPYPDDFLDIVMGGHVFGDQPKAEYLELARVVKPGGMIILCPGGNDTDDHRHSFLANQ